MTNKKFYYSSKDYLGRICKEEFTREGRWKRIYYTIAEDARPYFVHKNKRYYFDEILRASQYPFEVESEDGENVILCGYDANTYYKPIFVEVDESCEGVRVYRYETSYTEE